MWKIIYNFSYSDLDSAIDDVVIKPFTKYMLSMMIKK
jgi:hypothetical protein